MRIRNVAALVGLLLLTAASPPYNLDITHPGDTDIQSVFPANERTFRDNTNSYLNTEHDIATGFHKFQELTTTAKNALVSPPTGMLVYDTTLAVLQINTGTAVTPTWTNVALSIPLPVSPANGGTGLATVTLNGVMYGNGTANVGTVAAGTTGQVLKAVTSAAPVWGLGPGSWTAGTVNTLDPFANNSVSTQTHGLGAAPTQVLCALQNKTAELGYNSGDKVFMLTANNVTDTPFNVSADATNTYIATNASSVVPSIINRSTKASATITPANWKLVCTPYTIN